jgi:mannose-6-phosphate isomerase-like protein (cupin superfamily)
MRKTNAMKMKPKIIKANSLSENVTYERCSVAENYHSDEVSVARATVKAGVTTVAHHLTEVEEIYLITNGQGIVTIGGLPPTKVGEGDVVVIPAGGSQKITNTGNKDLVFTCICTPRFTPGCYVDEESQK